MLLCFHIVLAPSACFVRVFILVVSFHFEHSGSYCKDVGEFSAGHIIHVSVFIWYSFSFWVAIVFACFGFFSRNSVSVMLIFISVFVIFFFW